MGKNKKTNLGIMFRREYPPAALPGFARKTEEAGFDELWVVEDCFYTSGVAAAATALACTDAITVGLGIMPVVARNIVFTAMEIATLAGLYPGRFLPGLGHGVTEWMRQIGAFPTSQLAALEEGTLTIRQLLAGERVTFHGQHVHLDRGELVHPLVEPPPISLGVIGPKSLQVSGRVAGGTILSEYTNPAYAAWAMEQIQKGQHQANRDSQHRLTVFAFAGAAPTSAAARQALRPMVAGAIASGGIDTKLAPMGILPQVRELCETAGLEGVEAEMPDEWIDQLTIAGTPQDWSLAINRLVDLGIQSVVLVPHPDSAPGEVDRLARHIQQLDG